MRERATLFVPTLAPAAALLVVVQRDRLRKMVHSKRCMVSFQWEFTAVGERSEREREIHAQHQCA